jgi:outer membrane immunogenic protein
MKRFIEAGIAALAGLTIVSAAQAADLPRRATMPAKAPIYAAPYSWTGAYLGINGGYGWGSGDNTVPFSTGSFDVNGGVVGGTLGYNFQSGAAVFGLEGDIDWSGIKGSTACGGTSCETSNTWLGTARGRLGYAAGNFLPYITGGAAFGNIKNSIAGFGDASDTKLGWTVGGGVEAAINGPWSAKVEYLYVDLGSGATVAGSDTKFHTNLVRAGLNYRF